MSPWPVEAPASCSRFLYPSCLELMGAGQVCLVLRFIPKSLDKCPGANGLDTIDPGVLPNPRVPGGDVSYLVPWGPHSGPPQGHPGLREQWFNLGLGDLSRTGQPPLCFQNRETGHSTFSLLSESLAKLEAGTVTKCNFAGDGRTGASWTDNIMAQKSSEGATAETREQGDGAEDEEWVGQER